MGNPLLRSHRRAEKSPELGILNELRNLVRLGQASRAGKYELNWEKSPELRILNELRKLVNMGEESSAGNLE